MERLHFGNNKGEGKTACYNFAERKVGCHSSCPKYKTDQERWAQIKQKRIKGFQEHKDYFYAVSPATRKQNF